VVVFYDLRAAADAGLNRIAGTGQAARRVRRVRLILGCASAAILAAGILVSCGGDDEAGRRDRARRGVLM
jgi:hypothetical protein